MLEENMVIMGLSLYHTYILQDDKVVAPYAYKGNDWLGYDDVESVDYKARYAKDNGFGGAFIWSVETDDFKGKCGQGINPLINRISLV